MPLAAGGLAAAALVAQPPLLVDGPVPSGAAASIVEAFQSSHAPVRSQGVFGSPTGLAGVQVGMAWGLFILASLQPQQGGMQHRALVGLPYTTAAANNLPS